MTNRKPSIDGFVPRRPGSQLGDRHAGGLDVAKADDVSYRPTGLQPADQPILKRSELGIARADLDESLKGIDDVGESKKERRQRKKAAPKSRKRKIIKWVIILIVVAALAAGAWLAYKTLTAGGNVFKGNLLGLVQNKPLKQDANGRSNILVLGTSEDDPGHQGATLTDSMMIMSVDQKNKNAYMISIPRDLQVQYGELCNSGSRGKINEYFGCVGGDTNNIDERRAALTKEAQFIGSIVGLDIQYGVNVNYTVMRELVNAVGGITVNIEGSGGAPGIMDSNFDWKCGYGDRKVSNAERLRRCPPNGHFIEYPNGPAVLDAEHALYLAQARGDSAPTYGLGRSNFDRELNQQKIVKAIREKAMSAGVLTNLGKVSGIIDALGNNLRTTFEADEVQTLMNLAKDIKDQDIQSISLIDGDSPVMTTGNVGGVSVVIPSAGVYNYTELQALIKKKLTSNPVTREEANVTVLNGSDVAGVAQTEADKLTVKGFIVDGVDTAPEGTYAAIDIYQIGDGKPATKAKLEEIFGVKVKTTPSPVPATGGTNFVVIFGQPRTAE